MAPRTKPKTTATPGVIGDYLDDIAKPPSRPEDLARSSSEKMTSALSSKIESASSSKVESAKDQASRASKHHVSLYVTPGVDRAMKRLALDQEKRGWEIYHAALREYLDRHGVSFDDLMK